MKHSILRKISFLRGKILAISAIFAALSCKVAYAAFPLFAVAALPVVGMGAIGAKAASLKGTLSYAYRVIGYAELFLILALILLIVGSCVVIIKSLKRAKKKRKFDGLIALFSCLQSDLTILKTSGSKDDLGAVKGSKRKLVASLLGKLKERFFANNIDSNLLKRVTDLLKRIKKDEISIDNQMFVVDKCLQKVALLAQ